MVWYTKNKNNDNVQCIQEAILIWFCVNRSYSPLTGVEKRTAFFGGSEVLSLRVESDFDEGRGVVVCDKSRVTRAFNEIPMVADVEGKLELELTAVDEAEGVTPAPGVAEDTVLGFFCFREEREGAGGSVTGKWCCEP